MKDGNDTPKSKKTNNNDDETFVLRAYTHQELTKLYGISWPTFQKWLKPYLDEIGPKIGHYYTVRQVIIIFKKLGIPQRVKISVQQLNDLFNDLKS